MNADADTVAQLLLWTPVLTLLNGNKSLRWHMPVTR